MLSHFFLEAAIFKKFKKLLLFIFMFVYMYV